MSAVGTLEVVAPLAQAAALVHALLSLLAPADRLRVQAAAVGGARGLMARLAPAPCEPQDPDPGPTADGAHGARERCLTFSFEADDALQAFAAEQALPTALEAVHGAAPPEVPPASDGPVHVGCWWCTLNTGTLWLQFSATPATASMDELLHTSLQVQAAFLQFAQAVPGAALVRVDAWHQAVLLWADVESVAAARSAMAGPRPMPLPPLDAYCRHLLAHGRADSSLVYG